MTDPITIEKIELVGFRAFLATQTILLCNKKQSSIAIFGKNGTGKSCLIDSMEYYFSNNGTLNILGKKKTENQAGPTAIRHLDSNKTDTTYVHMWFKQGSEKFDDQHTFPDSVTNAAKRVLRNTKVPFIIRESDLNKFVLATSPKDRYNEVAGWLGMKQLSNIQDNLKMLRNQISNESKRNDGTAERLKDLEKCTDGAIFEWDDSKVLDWLNRNVLANLGPKHRFKILSKDDPAFQELTCLVETEQKQPDIKSSKDLLATINSLYIQPATHQEHPAGKIVVFEDMVLNLNNAIANEERIRSVTKESVFKDVWRSAQLLFNNKRDLDRCPVCETKFLSSPHGSLDNICVNLDNNISRLEKYAESEKEKNVAKTQLLAAKVELEKELDKFLHHASSLEYPCPEVDRYNKSLETWSVDKDAPETTRVFNELINLRASVEGRIVQIEKNEQCAFGNAIEKVHELFEIQEKLDLITLTNNEMIAVHEQITEQSNVFNQEITEYVQSKIGNLTKKMNDIYREIRGSDDVPKIKIELGKEGSVEQRMAQLLIDFEKHKKLAPSGFQSQSQINTLALAFRLAAIHIFNDAKIIILDDIVSSYDEEHRSNIVTVLDGHFKDFQIILSTHEKTFFDSLSRMSDKNHWQFKKIQYLKPGYGPMFVDYKTDIEKIKETHSKNKTAGNDMRRLVEKRLHEICIDFRTYVHMRANDLYELGELKVSLNDFLKKKNFMIPKNSYGKSIVDIFEKTTTLNRASHHRPEQSSSVGDEQHDLKIIEYFLKLFTCPKCKRDRFKKENDVLMCKYKKCNAKFSFQHLADTATLSHNYKGKIYKVVHNQTNLETYV